MPPDREVYERIIFMNSRQKNPQKTKLNKLWFWQWKWNIIKIIIGAVGGFVVQSLSHVQLFVTPWTVNARLPCPSVSPGVCSNSCTLNQCHPIISSPVTHFSSYPQSFPASGSFPITWLFASGGQSIGASSISPCNECSELTSFKIDWFDLPVVQGTLKCLLQHHSLKLSVLQCSAFFTISHIHT